MKDEAGFSSGGGDDAC